MEVAMSVEAEKADVVVMAAAVADFRPVATAAHKLTKDQGIPELVLERTPDILAGLAARRRDGQVIVGFAAETDDPLARARRKREAKGVDLMVVNDVSAAGVGFDHDTNAVTIVSELEDHEVPLSTKAAIADAVLDKVVELLAAQGRED
jgi:phosphopantothenoylcysteine decarboxylase/phosphopantothenate--cysteine ligase